MTEYNDFGKQQQMGTVESNTKPKEHDIISPQNIKTSSNQ